MLDRVVLIHFWYDYVLLEEGIAAVGFAVEFPVQVVAGIAAAAAVGKDRTALDQSWTIVAVAVVDRKDQSWAAVQSSAAAAAVAAVVDRKDQSWAAVQSTAVVAAAAAAAVDRNGRSWIVVDPFVAGRNGRSWTGVAVVAVVAAADYLDSPLWNGWCIRVGIPAPDRSENGS